MSRDKHTTSFANEPSGASGHLRFIGKRGYTWGLVLFTIILAAALRLVKLDHLPPGLSYDEAYNNLLAARLSTLFPPPVYFAADYGKEPAHIVLIAILYHLAGRPFADGGRLVSALAGIFNVGMLFMAAREIFRQKMGKDHASAIGALSAAALATLYWHVHFSRVGMEHIMVTALSTLAFYLFWLALNRGAHWLIFALAGGALGLCLYTYPSAYMLPLVVPLYWAWRWITQPSALRREWPKALAYIAGAIGVFAPHALFFVQHPEWFMTRPAQVAFSTSTQSAWRALLGNVARMIEGLFWRGDTNPRLNMPGRPALDFAQGIALVVGSWAGLKRPQRDGTIFVLIWFVVMLLPSIASNSAPHFGRALGATPPMAILIGLGLWQVARLPAKMRWLNKLPYAGALVVGVAFIYSGARTINDYFNVWANDPVLFVAFEVGLRQSSEYLASQPPETTLSLSPTPRDAPIFRFYLGERADKFKTFNGRRCVVYPYQPSADFVHVAIVADEQQSLPALQAAFPSGQVVHQIFDRGAPYAIVYRVPAGTRASVELDPQAVFGKSIELARPVTLERDTFKAGEVVALTLTWRALATPPANYTSFVHLARQAGQAPLAQEDAQPCDNSYPTTWWSPGEIIAEKRQVALPPDLPAGDYVLSTGWYNLSTGQRLQLETGSEYIALAAIQVQP